MVLSVIVSCPRIVILDVHVDLHLLPCLPRRRKRLVIRSIEWRWMGELFV